MGEIGWIIIAIIAFYAWSKSRATPFEPEKKADIVDIKPKLPTDVVTVTTTTTTNEKDRIESELDKKSVPDIPDADSEVADPKSYTPTMPEVLSKISTSKHPRSEYIPTTTYGDPNKEVVLTPYEVASEGYSIKRQDTAYRAVKNPINVNVDAVGGERKAFSFRAMFITMSPSEWKKDEEMRKIYAALYGPAWLDPVDWRGKVIENFDPVWVDAHKIVRYPNRRSDFYIYAPDGTEVIWNSEDRQVYIAP